jgi:chitinase
LVETSEEVSQRSPFPEKKDVRNYSTRNIIYFDSNANQIPLAGIAALPYTDVIVGFLVSGFTGSYDGIGFLTTLTSALAEALPSGQNIVTHAPQTPYWDSCWNNAPYAQIWQQVGNQIAWINNQFYNNPSWDATPDLKVQWYQSVAAITGAQKLMVGALVAEVGHDEGYLPLDQMVANVIVPLQATFGSQFGGVMGWQFAFDQAGAWGDGVGQALNA